MESAKNLLENKVHADISPTKELIVQSIAKVNQAALGIALGSQAGLGIFLLTNFVIVKGDALLSSNLALLNQYFWGYKITFAGSLIGLIYGFISGFILGWLIAFIRNFVIKIYLFIARYRERLISVNKFIDYP